MAIINIQMKPEGDNDFQDVIHPETNADMVVETANRKFMTSFDKIKLDNKADKNHNHDERYYTKGELMSPNKSIIAWENIRNRPNAIQPLPHTHTINDVIGLATALDGKASINHTHDYANKIHTHSMSDINMTGLLDVLDNKSDKNHTHSQYALTHHTHNYAASNHTHSFSSLTNVPADRTRSILYQTDRPTVGGSASHPNGTIVIVYK